MINDEAPILMILTWDSRKDLDLNCTLPSNKRINYEHKFQDGGSLDIDMNADENNSSDTPCETIAFKTASAGHYVVEVTNEDEEYLMLLKVHDVFELFRGKKQGIVCEFDYSPERTVKMTNVVPGNEVHRNAS